MAFISYKLGQKYYKVPYNLKKIGLYLTLSIGFSILSFYVFRAQYIVGGNLILILTAVVWAKEKANIKQLIKS
jgi:hypothetical protein